MMRNKKTNSLKWSMIRKISGQCQAFRMKLGISQREVAASLGLPQQSISNFEIGSNNSIYIYQWYLDQGFQYKEE